jgi:hypothetical protein
MRTLTTFGATFFATCVTAIPAFADPIGGILGDLGGFFHHSPPAGAPAPLLAAGIPAFIAIGGGALVMKLIARRRNPAE